MKIKSYSIEKEGLKGYRKRPMLLLNNEEGCSFPAIYFQKPKHVPDKLFKKLINCIKLNAPKDLLEDIEL